jgi:hypothetical protein
MVMTGEVFGGSGVDAAITEAPMKAQRRFGLALSWPPITSALVRWLWDVVGPRDVGLVV